MKIDGMLDHDYYHIMVTGLNGFSQFVGRDGDGLVLSEMADVFSLEETLQLVVKLMGASEDVGSLCSGESYTIIPVRHPGDDREEVS